MKSSVVLSFRKLPQAELGDFAANVITKMTQDAQFVSLQPQVTVLKTTYDAFVAAAINAKDGGKSATLDKNNKKDELTYQLGTVARYVDVLANENEAVVLAAGYNVRKKATAVTELATPTNLVAENAELLGSVYLSWSAVEGATIYAIERRVKGTDIWQNGEYRGGRSAVLEGLESDVRIEFRVRAIHSSGIKSNYSQPIEVLVS